MASHLSRVFQRGSWFLLLLMIAAGLPSRCDCACLSKQYWISNRGGGHDGMNRLGKWESAVPTYALNWPQHQGTIEDLVEANLKGTYGENALLASWAAAAASDAEQEKYAIDDDIKFFKSNPCAPGRDCTHYEQVADNLCKSTVAVSKTVDLQRQEKTREEKEKRNEEAKANCSTT